MVPSTEQQIAKLTIEKSKPLIIVDADEVLLYFARPFSQFLKAKGWELNLTGYRLDNAIIHTNEKHFADKNKTQQLVKQFITEETYRQPATKGAATTLRTYAEKAQIIILSNVPKYAHEHREKNLFNVNMNYPLISNKGPKGPALKEISLKSSSKIIFIDDSPFQINSAAEYVPDIFRFHFTACDLVRKTLPHTKSATHNPKSWKEVSKLIKELLF